MDYSGVIVITREQKYDSDYGAVKRTKKCVSLNGVEIFLGDFIRTSGIIKDNDIIEDAINDFYRYIQKNINSVNSDEPVRIHFDAEYGTEEGEVYSIEASLYSC